MKLTLSARLFLAWSVLRGRLVASRTEAFGATQTVELTFETSPEFAKRYGR